MSFYTNKNLKEVCNLYNYVEVFTHLHFVFAASPCTHNSFPRILQIPRIPRIRKKFLYRINDFD